MEVNQTRPIDRMADARSHKTQVDSQQFSSTKSEQQSVESLRTDANTRLSREVDQAEISKEARSLAEREKADDAERQANEGE